ncbi:MAG TPA: hypothetical protein VN823_25890 [Stellaceae bacterium]|nr:hypothetical protein [Stellaceae bacterium]
MVQGSMVTRTTTKAVTLTRSFILSGLDGVQPAGTYIIETDEELIPTLSFTAYRRTATWLRLPRRRSGARPPAGLSEIVAIDPVELDSALARDAAAGQTVSEPEADRRPIAHHPQPQKPVSS